MKSKNLKMLLLIVLFSLVGIITYTAVNYINTMNVPEDIKKSTGAVQNYGKPVSITDSKSSVAIGVFYPKTNDKKANTLFEDIAKKYMDDAKSQTKNYKAGTNAKKTIIKVDYQVDYIADRYINVLFDHKQYTEGEDPATVTSTYKTVFYDTVDGKELTSEEIFKGKYLLKLSSLLKKDFIKDENYRDTIKTPKFKENIAPKNENFDIFFMHDDVLDVYFEEGRLSKNSKQTFKSIPLNDLKRYLAVTIFDDQDQVAEERVIDPDLPMIALTFDDGPHASNTQKILDLLKENDGSATFFVLGVNAKRYPDVLKKIVDSGNQLASHTYNHKDLRRLKVNDVQYEINETDNVIKEGTGGYSNTALRPPYGAVNQTVIDNMPHPIIMWSIDTLDWKNRNKRAIMDSIANAQDGDIILFHDIHDTTADAMIEAIPMLAEKGFQLVTIDEMFEARGIVLEPGKEYRKAVIK